MEWLPETSLLALRLILAIVLGVGGTIALNVVYDIWLHRKTLNSAPSDKTKIVAPPGYRARRLIEWVFSPKTSTMVLLPVLDDMEVEFFEALDEGRNHKAKWVVIRAYMSLLLTFIFWVWDTVLARVRKILKAV